MKHRISRRTWVQSAGLLAGAACLSEPVELASAQAPATKPRIRYCLNTSTIRGQELSLVEEIDLCAKAGYDAIEPWIGEINKFQEQGGDLADLAKRIQDAGLTVESAIGFAKWIVDDASERQAGLEQMKRDMDVLRQIGGIRIAAPPVGATDRTDMNLFEIAVRYRDLLALGKQMGVTPQLELWGFSKTLSRLGELAFVATEAAHPDACLLTDVYHIYKGGSDFAGLQMLNGHKMHVMHMNDYPDMERSKINDADRVYPGDGVAPISSILQSLFAAGFSGVLSVELFNREYWKQDALTVISTSLAKMKDAVAAVA